MEFTKINTFPIVEESVFEGDLICEVEVDVADDQVVQYELQSSSSEYFSILENKIYITTEGVQAINEDYPEDISKEITSLVFSVIAISNGESISQTVTVPVTRIIDNPPYITNHYETHLYTDDLYPGILVSKLFTIYNAYCNILGEASSYFELEAIPDDGSNNFTIKLNDTGVNYFTNFNFDEVDTEIIDSKIVYKFEINLEFVDVTNSKSTLLTISSLIFKGSSDTSIPVKNNLELQAESLAEKISEIVSEQENILNKNNFDIEKFKEDIKNLLVSTRNSKNNFLELQNIINNIFLLLKESMNIQNEKLNIVSTINNDSYEIIYNLIGDFLENDYSSDKAELFNDISNNKSLLLSNTFTNTAMDTFLINRINKEFSLRFENYSQSIQSYLIGFRSLINSNIISPFTTKLNELASGLNNLFSETATIGNKAYEANSRALNADNNISYLDNRLQTLESFTLENWGTTSGWKFSDEILKYAGDDIISVSSSMVTIKHENKIALETETGFVYWDGEILELDNNDGDDTTVKADYFTGTATSAKYADVAEYYKKEKNPNYKYESGTIVYINRNKPSMDFEVTEDSLFNCYCGVITTSPGFILNSDKSEDENYINIALVGRVPVKITGVVKKGMFLYPSEKNPNIAEGSYDENRSNIIGIALENSNGKDIVLCKVK